ANRSAGQSQPFFCDRRLTEYFAASEFHAYAGEQENCGIQPEKRRHVERLPVWDVNVQLRIVGARILANEVGASEGGKQHQRGAEHHQKAEPTTGKPLARSPAIPWQVVPRIAATASGRELVNRAASTGIRKLNLLTGWRLERGHRGALHKDTSEAEMIGVI